MAQTPGRTRRVVALAAVVSFVPWLLGGLAALLTRAHDGFPLTADGAFAGADADRWLGFADDWFTAASYAMPIVTAVLVALWVVALAPRSRWTVAALATGIFALVVLLMSFGAGLVEGADSATGYAFVALLLALVTLQLPVCFVLAAWLSSPWGVLARPTPRPTWVSR